jgi:formylmethanofuran dehydrogenase subunit A
VLTRLKGGRVIDPANARDGVGDVWLRDGRIAAPPEDGRADETHDVAGKVVMAGAIDIHSHIASSNVNTARLMLPEERRAGRHGGQGWLGASPFTTQETGRLYAAMGFTTVVEPAVSPLTALHAHLELADIPILDTGILLILGNDDFLLSALRVGEGAGLVEDYVAWVLAAGRGLGVKCINPGGAAAFKFNARAFSLDDIVPAYGVSSRQIVLALQGAVESLGVPHPLHLHCNNLGIPGNAGTPVATLDAAADRPLHLAHLQFYGYGREGPRGLSSAAPMLVEAMARHPRATFDVGQVMFGPTVTISSDTLCQFNQRGLARPRKWNIWEGDANGAGVYPIRYRERAFVNAVQWAIGLELFLLADDPWRVFFTTDHPNGAPFTTYPDLFRLLMDADERARWIERLPASARSVTVLGDLTREYTLFEIATMTRAAPARLLGLADRGHLAPGALADVAVYPDLPDRAEMFRAAHLVFKSGALVVRDGKVVAAPPGRILSLAPEPDPAIGRRLAAYFEDTYGVGQHTFSVSEGAVAGVAGREGVFEDVPCRP